VLARYALISDQLIYRAFSLPTTVDTENVKAEYDPGVLKLELNKRAEAKPKRIKIGVGSATSEKRPVEAAKSAA
jgi:HSP20 family protein